MAETEALQSSTAGGHGSARKLLRIAPLFAAYYHLLTSPRTGLLGSPYLRNVTYSSRTIYEDFLPEDLHHTYILRLSHASRIQAHSTRDHMQTLWPPGLNVQLGNISYTFHFWGSDNGMCVLRYI